MGGPGPDQVVVAVAKRVAELRVRAGMSQFEAANAYGTALRNWQRIEAGQNLTVHTLARIAGVLGVSFVDLCQIDE